MTAARPERPDTARELIRVGSGRLVGMPSNSANVDSGAAVSGEKLAIACARLGSPSTAESLITTLAVVDKELRLCQGDGAVDALRRCFEVMASTDPRINLRAASILVKWCEDGPMLSAAVRALATHAKEGRASEMRVDGAFDALVHRLKAAKSPALVQDGLAVLRYASSSEGNSIMQHFVTIGVLPVLNQLATQHIDNPDIMVHAATLLRNFSVDFCHHMLKVGSLPIICTIFDKCLSSKEIISLASRATAKLVYDDGCLAWFVENSEQVRSMLIAAASYIGSKMIALRLIGTTLTRILEESVSARQMLSHEMPQLLQEVVQNLRAAEKRCSSANSAPDDHEVLMSMLRFVAAATLDENAGQLLVIAATDAVMEIVQDKDLESSREMVLNCLFTLSNLSFYYTLVSDTEAERITESVGPLVAAIIFNGDIEGCVEATRLLGNLTATSAGSKWAENNRLDEACLLYVGHEDARIVYNCFGVLLNLTSRSGPRVFEDADLCRQLLEQTGKHHTTNDGSSPDDVEIAEVVEKVLLNLTNHC